MAEDHRISISSSNALAAEEVARRSFPTVRRGYDPTAVKSLQESVARELRESARREEELRNRVAALERRLASPDLDESALSAAVGAETTRILQAAHDAARDLVAQAEQRAEEVMAKAVAVLGARKTEGEAEASRLIARATDESMALLEQAAEESAALREATKDECRAVVREVQGQRTRIINDLRERRHAMRAQLEQLRAGRDHLLGVIGVARVTIDELIGRLAGADAEAREAVAAAPTRLDAAAVVAVGAAVGAAPYLADGATTAPPGEEMDDEPAVATTSVDELFARVRASRDAAVMSGPGETPAQGGQAALAEDEPVTTVVPAVTAVPLVQTVFDTAQFPAAAPESRRRTDVTDAELPPTEAMAVIPPGDGAADAGANGAGPAVGVEAGEPDPGGDGTGALDAGRAEIVRRDELLEPVTERLSRALKRALHDDQNELLDQIRNARAGFVLEDVLPLSAQMDRYRRAAAEHLQAARRAGADFVSPGVKPADDGSDSDAAALAAEVTATLRERLVAALADRSPGGQVELSGAVGATYRDWKGERIEELAGDHATASFSAAELAALITDGEHPHVTWLVDDHGVRCPDCDDNALAGPLLPGEQFPTGQLHPPAHPGCRCVLAPGGN